MITYQPASAIVAQSTTAPAGEPSEGLVLSISATPGQSLDTWLIDAEIRNVTNHDVLLFSPELEVTKNFYVVDTQSGRVLNATGGTDSANGHGHHLDNIPLQSGQSWFGSIALQDHVFGLKEGHRYSIQLDVPFAGSSSNPPSPKQRIDLSSNVIFISTLGIAETSSSVVRSNGFTGLHLKLSSLQSSYRKVDAVLLSLSIKNTRGTDTTVTCLPAPYGTELQVTSADGSLVPKNMFSRDQDPLVSDARSTWHGIANSSEFDCFTNVALTNWGYRLGVGKYQIALIYYDSPYAPIISNTIGISIRP